MPSNEFLRVEGAEQLRRLSKDLRKHEDGKEIRSGVVAALKDVADDIVQAERSAVLALPSKGESARRGRRSLRRRTASATVSRVRTGAREPEVSVLINEKRMGSQAALPAYMNAEPGFTEWNHQVFGTSTWVGQAATPWWDETAAPFEDRVQRRLIGVLDQVADQIERGA